MVEELKSHLLQRSFANVFNNLRNQDEKNNPIALLLMCALDFEVEKRKLYARIANTQCPKLLLDLMGFRTYKSFFYYEYQNHGQLESKYLKCKFCELYGPYVLILTHMTINHDEHIGLVMCAYCDQTELKDHFRNGSIQACYEQYLQKPDVADVIGDDLIPKIVTEFYGCLKFLSIKLGVHTRRILHIFTGSGFGKIEPIAGRKSRYEVFYKQRKVRKTLSCKKLDSIVSETWVKIYNRPIPISISIQNDNVTSERSTRSNRSNVNGQNENVNESEQQPNGLGSNSSMPGTSAQTSDTNKTAEAKFGDYVAHRLQMQKAVVKRRRLEAAIQQTISNFEIVELENE